MVYSDRSFKVCYGEKFNKEYVSMFCSDIYMHIKENGVKYYKIYEEVLGKNRLVEEFVKEKSEYMQYFDKERIKNSFVKKLQIAEGVDFADFQVDSQAFTVKLINNSTAFEIAKRILENSMIEYAGVKSRIWTYKGEKKIILYCYGFLSHPEWKSWVLKEEFKKKVQENSDVRKRNEVRAKMISNALELSRELESLQIGPSDGEEEPL